MVRNNGRSSRWPMASTRSLVTTYATYGTLSLRVDYQPPSQKPRFARCLQGGDLSKIRHMFSYSTSTVRQILPVIIAGYRQILPIQALECTYLLGLQAGMETAIYRVSPNHPKGANNMKHIPAPIFFWVIVILVLFADTISRTLTSFILN